MKRAVHIAVLLVFSLTLSQVAFIDTVQAQGSHARAKERAEQRTSGRQTQQADEPERYPDATRQSPAKQTNQRQYQQIAKAYGDLNNERVDAARSNLLSLESNTRLTDYERALVYQGLGQIAYEEDQIDSAMGYWARAIETDALPNNEHFQLMYQIAQIELSEERYEQSVSWLERWFSETRSANPEALAMRGNIYYRLERYPEAISILEEAINASDNPQTALFELMMASYYELEDYAGAARSLERLVARQPDEIKHQMNLAQTYLQMDENTKALDILRNARSRNLLTQPEHWRQLYQLLAYGGEPAEAATVINQGIAAGHLQEDLTTLRALGDNLYQSEQLDAAIAAYGKAVLLSEDGNAYQQLGHLLTEAERPREARDALSTAFQKGGLRDPGIAYLLLGQAENDLDNVPAARAAFQKALDYENSRASAQSWLRNL